MWKYARTITGDDYAADDVVQSAFIQLMGKTDVLDSLNCYQLDAYVSITIKHLALKHIAQKQRTLPVEAEELETMLEEENPVDTANLITNRVAIQSAMEKLSHQSFNIIILRYQFDQTYEQIGNQLDMKPGTARVTVHRALKQLKEHLREVGHGAQKGQNCRASR